MRIYSAVPVLGVAFLLVLSPTPPAAPPTPATPVTPSRTAGELPLRRLGSWTTSGAREARRVVARDVRTWIDAWEELHLGPRPPIDFAHEAAVVVALGAQPSGGWEVRIERVTAGGDGHAVVEVVVRGPDHACALDGGDTAPVDAVGVAAGAVRSWEFAERREVRPCP